MTRSRGNPAKLRLPKLLDPSLDLHAEILDSLPLGVIVLSADGRVLLYNSCEAAISHRRREDVIGGELFAAVAPCMNVPPLIQAIERALTPDGGCTTIPFLFHFPHRPQVTQVKLHFRPFKFNRGRLAAIFVEYLAMAHDLDKDEFAHSMVALSQSCRDLCDLVDLTVLQMAGKEQKAERLDMAQVVHTLRRISPCGSMAR